jgi:DNA repair protein RecN (Recombination protein N)
MVFDEVDAGIGGRVAEAVGRRLRGIAALNQVLCVTHLPQIAAFADQHIQVSKEAVGGRTETRIAILNGEQRREELARMLGGERITESAYRHADELLQQAQVTSNSAR